MSLRLYSEILFSSTPSKPMLVFFHTFDSSSLKFKDSHSSANTDDRYKGFALSSHEHTCFICINTKQDRRLTPTCNLQRGWRPSEQPGQREAASALFLMPHMSTETKQQSWKTMRKIKKQKKFKLLLNATKQQEVHKSSKKNSWNSSTLKPTLGPFC